MVTVLQLTQVECSRKLSNFYHNCSCWTRRWQRLSFLIQRKRNGISSLKASSSWRADMLIRFPDLGTVSLYVPWKMFSPWQNLLVLNPCSRAWLEPRSHLQTRDLWLVLHAQRAMEIHKHPCPTSLEFLTAESRRRSLNCLPCTLEGPIMTFAYLMIGFFFFQVTYQRYRRQKLAESKWWQALHVRYSIW